MNIPLEKPSVTFRLIAIGLLAGWHARSANYDFDNGGGTGDWNLNTNWNADGLPSTNDNVFVLVHGSASKTITLASTPVNPTINELGLAREGNGTATVNQTGGSLTVRSWFNLGQGFGDPSPDNGTGIWNMSGTSTLTSNHSNGGQTVIGAGFAASPTYNTGILTLSDSAQFIQSANEIRIAGESATSRAHGTITLNNSSLLSHTGGGAFIVGVGANGSTGTLNIHDTSALTTAGSFIVATNTGFSGTVLQDGTSTVMVNGGWATVGGYGVGTYVMNGGTLGFTGAFGLNVGDNPGGIGTMTVNAGQVNVNGVTTPDLFVGKSSATGTLTVNNNAQVAVNRNIYLGYSGVSSTGTLTVNNTASVTGASIMVWAGAGTVNVNGGTVSTTGWMTLGQNAGSTAVFNHNAGNVTTPELWTTFQATGTYNLNGGTLTTGNFLKNTGTGIINFNGGTLKASAGFTLGGGNVTTVQVRNGGAILDSNGQNATISQALIHSGIGGDNATDGGLTKNGIGAMTLSGVNTYNGATQINAGTLQLGSGGATGSLNTSSSITNNGTLSINRNNTVTQGTDFAGVIGGTGNFLHAGTGTVVLNGNNTFSGTVTVNPQATLSVPVIATSGAQPLGQGSTPITLRGQLSNFGTLHYSGAGAGATNRGITLEGGSGGKITVSQASGVLTVNGALTGSVEFRKDGPGTLILTGSEDWNSNGYVQAGTLILGSTTSGSPGSNSLTGGNWDISSGATLRINTTGTLESSTITKSGTFLLESGS